MAGKIGGKLPKTGDFMVTATSGIVGRLIRLITHSKVNHAAICIGGNYIIEAEARGVRINTVSAYPKAIWSDMTLTDMQRQKSYDEAVSLLGTPYSFLDIAAQFFVRVFGWHAPKWALDRLADPGHLQCAQVVELVYERIGIDLLHGKPMGLISPEDLLEDIEAQHG